MQPIAMRLRLNTILEEFPAGKKCSSNKSKINDEVLEKQIRPCFELGTGGLKMIAFKEEKEIVIACDGSCFTCHSSTGSTLNAIQKILRARVHLSLFATLSL